MECWSEILNVERIFFIKSDGKRDRVQILERLLEMLTKKMDKKLWPINLELIIFLLVRAIVCNSEIRPCSLERQCHRRFVVGNHVHRGQHGTSARRWEKCTT